MDVASRCVRISLKLHSNSLARQHRSPFEITTDLRPKAVLEKSVWIRAGSFQTLVGL